MRRRLVLFLELNPTHPTYVAPSSFKEKNTQRNNVILKQTLYLIYILSLIGTLIENLPQCGTINNAIKTI